MTAVTPDPTCAIDARRRAIQSVFWAAVWLAAVLVAVKAHYLTVPRAVPWADEQATLSVRLLAAISYRDVLLVSGLWITGRAVSWLAIASSWESVKGTGRTFSIFARGVEQLYDLDRDPTEQHNLAMRHPDRCARLRQRLAARTEANRLQYERAN